MAGRKRITQRITWIDAARGGGIILVVLGHALRGVHERGLLDPAWFEALDTRIYAFHMPLFFLLSGIVFLDGLKGAHPGRYVQSRFWRLIYPLLLWTYVFLAFKAAAGSMSNSPLETADLFVSPIPGRWHFWFLWALFVIQIAFLAVLPLAGRVPDAVLAPGLLAVSIALLWLPLPGALTPWIGLAVIHLPYFVAGICLGVVHRRLELPPWAGASALAVFAVLVWTLPFAGMALPLGPLLTAMVLSLLFVAVFVALGNGAAGRWFAVLGQASMAIFLAHTIFSAALREVLLKLGVTDGVLHVVSGTLIGLAAPLVLYVLARRFGWTRRLGF